MTIYDRTVARMSRRELMKLGCMRRRGRLDATARRPPPLRQADLRTRIRSRSASPPAIRCPTASCCGPGWRRSRSKAAACRWRLSKSAGRSRAIARFQNIVQKGIALARPELGHSVHVEVERPRARPRILLSLPRRRRSQPDRPHEDRAAGRRRRRSAALRRLRLQPLRGRLLHRVPPHRRGAVRLRLPHRRLHLRRARRRRPQRSRAAAQRQEIYTLVDYRNRYALYKTDPRSDGGARVGAVRHDLGRPRGRQRLRRRPRRARHAAGAVPAAPRRRLSGLLRDDAAARERAPVGQPHAALPAAAVRQPDRLERARHAAVPIRSGLRRRRAQRLRRGARARRGRCSARSRSGGCSTTSATAKATWTVLGQQVPTFARDTARRRSRRPLLDGQVGRLRRGAPAALRAAAGNEGAEPDRALRRRARALRRRPQDRLHEPALGRPSASSSRTRRSRPTATAASGADVGADASATTRTSSSTAPGAATSPARRRRRRCAPTSRSSTG